MFSTYLFTGTGSALTITNGIDLSTNGGLVWYKSRSAAGQNYLGDTARGSDYTINSNTTGGNAYDTTRFTSFNTTGFSFGSTGTVNGYTYASWTFRKQPKFFDVVTYTGNGTAGRTVAHNLGSVPGCIIVKKTSSGDDWAVYHRSLGATQFLLLNDTLSAGTSSNYWNNTSPTSTEFTLGAIGTTNASGSTYVAYLFAHDAGGFGLTGTDNVVSCGSFTTDGSGDATVSLGYEPQWVLTKSTNLTDQWYLLDSMRGWPVTTASTKILAPNTSDAETTGTFGNPTATGFTIANGGAAKTYVYVAIRRGPMKVPTSGTSVFAPVTTTTNNTITTNFPVDLSIFIANKTTSNNRQVYDRLRGAYQRLLTTTTGAETTSSASPLFDNNTGTALDGFAAGESGVDWAFRRAPSFFDEVCYTGSGNSSDYTLVNHNLGVPPELIIIKRRNAASTNWVTSSQYLPNGWNHELALNNSSAQDQQTGNNYSPTSTTFQVSSSNLTAYSVDTAGGTYVAYLFATCAGVSKVGSYTGTGTTKQVDCGFTAGARFVLIKRADASGDWYVWDTARGIVSGNDSYLLLNSTAAEVTNTDYIDTYSAGFEISSTAPAAINASGGSFIFFAVA